jgi:predicted Zn-dependent protease
MENESQLAGVLAHEISHFKKSHSLKQVKASNEDSK